MNHWATRLLLVLGIGVVALYLTKLVARLAGKAYVAITHHVDRLIGSIAVGGGSSVEQVVQLALTLVVVALAVKFLVRGRL